MKSSLEEISVIPPFKGILYAKATPTENLPCFFVLCFLAGEVNSLNPGIVNRSFDHFQSILRDHVQQSSVKNRYLIIYLYNLLTNHAHSSNITIKVLNHF